MWKERNLLALSSCGGLSFRMGAQPPRRTTIYTANWIKQHIEPRTGDMMVLFTDHLPPILSLCPPVVLSVDYFYLRLSCRVIGQDQIRRQGVRIEIHWSHHIISSAEMCWASPESLLSIIVLITWFCTKMSHLFLTLSVDFIINLLIKSADTSHKHHSDSFCCMMGRQTHNLISFSQFFNKLNQSPKLLHKKKWRLFHLWDNLDSNWITKILCSTQTPAFK